MQKMETKVSKTVMKLHEANEIVWFTIWIKDKPHLFLDYGDCSERKYNTTLFKIVKFQIL